MARILILSPHPDDEVLGCGGAIAAHADAGHEVRITHLTSGERGSGTTFPPELGPQREREAAQAASRLGVSADHVQFLRFPDGGINPCSEDQFTAVLQVLREVRPELLYLPHRFDGSFDHEQAHILCWRAAAMSGSRNYPEAGLPYWVPTVLGYEVWAPIITPAYLVDISPAQIERKLAALTCYRSQGNTEKGASQASHIGPAALHLSGFRGATTTGGHREAFTVLRLGKVLP